MRALPSPCSDEHASILDLFDKKKFTKINIYRMQYNRFTFEGTCLAPMDETKLAILQVKNVDSCNVLHVGNKRIIRFILPFY